MSIARFWPPLSHIDDCIQPEAEVPRFEVLLAAHRSMRFTLEQDSQTRIVDEHDLLKRFLDPHVQRGTALLKVAGSSGVGKSHVIRWLDAQLRARDDSSSRHIIRLPKSTSLKGAIGRILEGLEGQSYNHLRSRLTTARDHLDIDDAAIVLTANLQIAIKRQIHRAKDAISAAVRRGDRGLESDRLWMTHESLIDVLIDPGLRHRWIGHETSPGVLSHVAERVLKDGIISDAETKLQFKEKDLSFSQEEISGLSVKTRTYIHLLNTSQGKHKRDAITLLNSVIDKAANQLLQLGDTGLTEIFDELRKALLNDKKELVVLIEDFAVLSGMQGALLDALIKEAIVGGEQVRCTMRTALAVTTGYVLPDTAKTRATGEYLIEDSPFENENASVDAIVELVGRYLNVARLGSAKLISTYRQRDQQQANWVPRFEEIVDLNDEEEASRQAFDVTTDGFSLFPFNRAALRQLAKSRFSKSQQSSYSLEFNPRKILQLIRETLVNCREDFEQGQFPPAHFGNADERNQVSAEVEAAIRHLESDPLKRRRLEALVRFWGNDPQSGRPEDWELPSQVLSAFGFRNIGTLGKSHFHDGDTFRDTKRSDAGLSQFGIKKDETTGAQEGPEAQNSNNRQATKAAPHVDVGQRGPSRSPLNNESEKWKSKIDAWRSGQNDLLQDDATQLRQWIAEDVLSSVNWDFELLPTPKGDFLKDFRKYVFIPRAGAPGNATEVNCSVRVTTMKNLGNREAALEIALAMQALVRWKLEGSWSFDSDGAAYARWAQFLEMHRDQAVTFYRAQLGEGLLPQAARALYIGTRMLNIPGSHSDNPADVIHALFVEGPLLPTIDTTSSQREVSWEGVQIGASAQRKILQQLVLRFVGVRQGGDDKIYALDYERANAALGDVARTLSIGGDKSPSTDNPDLKNAVEHVKVLRNHFLRVLDDHASSLATRLIRYTQSLGDAPDTTQLKTQIDEMCGMSLALLSFQVDLSEKLRRSCEVATTLPLETLHALPKKVNLNSTLTHVSSVNAEALKKTEVFLAEFERFTNAVQSRLKAGGLVTSTEMLVLEERGIRNELNFIAQLAEIELPGERAHSDDKIRTSPKRTKEKQKRSSENTPEEFRGSCGGIFAKCEEIVAALKEYGALQQLKDKAETLCEHREKLESRREALVLAKKPWQLLKEHNVKGLRNPKCPHYMLAAVSELYRRLNNSEPLNSGQEFAKFLEGVEAVAASYQKAASEAWKLYRESDLYPTVSVDLVRTFQRVAAFASKAFELEKAILVLNDKSENIPNSESDWSECHKAQKRCKDLADKLPLQNLPKQVSRFLLDTVAGGAALSELTKEVKDWVREHDLERSFVIRAASSVSQPDRLL